MIRIFILALIMSMVFMVYDVVSSSKNNNTNFIEFFAKNEGSKDKYAPIKIKPKKAHASDEKKRPGRAVAKR